MSSRFYIVSDKRFPHGDAGGNRIEYLARCLLLSGISSTIVSLGKETSSISPFIKEASSNNTIEFLNARCSKNPLARYFFSGLSARKVLKRLGLSKCETAIVYSSNPFFILPVKRLFRRNAIDIYYDVVEWDDYHSFRAGRLNLHYWFFHWCFYKIYPTGKGVIAISTNIASYFSDRCPVFLFPICLDPSEFQKPLITTRGRDEIIRFIYSGNPENKDDIECMVEAISMLGKEDLSRIELHFTAVSKRRIQRLLGKKQYLLEKLNNTIVFHNWMEYTELVDFYHSMDALLMMRYNNQVSRSNFPSKVPELLSCGVCIIANNVGDFFSFLEDGVNAIEIKGNNLIDCYQAILRYISFSNQKRKELSDNAIICAENKFSYKRYSNSLYSFFVKNA